MRLLKNAIKSYFLELKEKRLKKLKTSVDVQREVLIAKNKLLEFTVEQSEAHADKFSFAEEKKTSLADIKATISKASAIKRDASEKQEKLEKLQNKKKRIM